MPTTFEPIATSTLGSAASSITFSSIPNTYTDLRLVVVGTASSAGQFVRIRYNGDTGSNYSFTVLAGDPVDGNGAYSTRATSAASDYSVTGWGSSSTQPTLYTWDIFSYAGSTNKTNLATMSSDNDGTHSRVIRAAGLWRNTSAITSVEFSIGSGTWNTGTTATLYGILKAQGQIMANTYTLIASNTLTGTTATVTFSSIPQTYTDLVLRISARTGRTDPDIILLTFNSDSPSSGTTYSDTQLYASSTSPASGRNSNAPTVYGARIDGANETVNTFSSTEFYIPNYTVSANKPFSSTSVYENNSTTVFGLFANANLWRNTAAVTQINMSAVSSFVAGSSFFLYGVKNT